MKTILSFALALFSLGSFAQGINITFAGSRTGRNHQVVIDGASYYSKNAVSNTSGSTRATIKLTEVAPGSHNLDVYRVSTNSSSYPNGTMNAPTEGESVYNKVFQTRLNYDMTITIRDNGTVSFTETKAVKKPAAQPTATPVAMTSTNFNALYKKVSAQRYQSQRISMIKTAFSTKAYYFNTTQVRQLISLVSSENSRFDLAKLSYNKVTNKDDFITVYDVLKSESKRDALDEYVVSQGGVSTEIRTEVVEAPVIVESPVGRYPMSTYNFDQAAQRIQNLNYQGDRVAEIRNLLNNSTNYFTTAQLKRLLTMVSNETDRLSLARTSWTRAYETSTFNQIVDLFYDANNREALNQFILSNGGTANNSTYSTAMSDVAFNTIYNKAKNHFRPWNTTEDVNASFNNTANNFSTAQVRQLLMLVGVETDRLAAAKIALARTVDKVNFAQLADLFNSETNRNEFNRFVNSQ